MAISTTSSVAGVLVLIIASGFVLTSVQTASSDALTCANFSSSCHECLDDTNHKNISCPYFYEVRGDGPECSSQLIPVVEAINPIINASLCPQDPPAPKTTTPVPPTTTNATTTSTPSTTTAPSNATTTAPTTTPTSTTTPTPAPSPAPSNSTTTAAPTTTSTTVPPTTAAPSHGGGGMSWASFFGGIVFTAAVSSVAYLVWRFYKARQERNYHTFTNPSTF